MSDDDDDEPSGSLSKRSRAHDPETGPTANEDGTIVSKHDRESSPSSPVVKKDTEEVRRVTKGVKEVELGDKEEKVDEAAASEAAAPNVAEQTADAKDASTIDEPTKEPLLIIPEASESTNVVLVLDEPKGDSDAPRDDTPADSVTDEQSASPSPSAEKEATASDEDASAEDATENTIEVAKPTAAGKGIKVSESSSMTIPAASLPLPPSPQSEKLQV